MHLSAYGSRLNSTATLDTASYTKYFNVPQGEQSYQIKKPFDINTNTVQSLFSITIPEDEYYYHSLFITDEKVDDAFAVTDPLGGLFPAAKTDTCAIRFVNSTPGSTGFDVTYGNISLSKNLTFKQAGQFTYVSTTLGASVNLLIALKVLSTGTTTALVTDSVQLNSNGAYTFYTVGKPGTTGFGIRMIENL